MPEFTRSEITFEQAEGLSPLPSQMALRELSDPLRAFLLNETLVSIQREMREEGNRLSLATKWGGVFTNYCLERGLSPANINTSYTSVEKSLNSLFMTDSYGRVLGAVEYFVRNLRDTKIRVAYAISVRGQLERLRCAYRLIDNSIMPVATPEEGAAIQTALNVLSAKGMGGARSHIINAGSALTAGNFTDSIRESIHAVESTARALTGKLSLREALNELVKIHPMHSALKEGLNRIYGYTSDANGIRHPIVGDEAPEAGEAEALFMLGACASFVTFLSRIAARSE